MSAHEPFTINQSSTHIHVALNPARWVVSSAVLNGGRVQADHLINVKVPENFNGAKTDFILPEITLANYSQALGLSGCVVGMMTSTSMTSFRQVKLESQRATVTALVTTGVSNAKRAGEPAEWRKIGEASPQTGTINIMIITNLLLTQAAMIEAVMMVTEAKTVAMADLGITSSKTGQLATGTGTDAIAIVAGVDPPNVRYCGKHVLFGEMLATATIQALTESLAGRI